MRRLWAIAWVGLALVAPATVQAQLGAAARGVTPQTAGWRFLPGFSMAYDSFGQRYVVTDDDTFDLYDELSARLHTTIDHQGSTKVRLQNMFSYGQEATRNDLVARLERPFGTRFELRTEQALRYKAYVQNSDNTFSSNYLVGTTRGTALMRPAAGWRLRIDDRFEWAAFDSTSRYNYNYRLNDAGGEIERQYGVFSHLRAGYTYGTRSVPDSTAIDYRRHIAIADWQQDIGRHSLGFEHRLERRYYGDPRVRSHFWDYDGALTGRVELHERVRLRPEYRGVVTHYDRPDSIWSNSTQQSVEMLVEGDASRSTVLAIGPRGEFRRTTSAIDRAYNQWGLKGSVTFTLGNTLWLQFTDEAGLRQHLAGDDLLYSDYSFNWSTLYLTWQPLPRLGCDIFFSLNPESHADKTNDTTTLLLSTSLTYGWR